MGCSSPVARDSLNPSVSNNPRSEVEGVPTEDEENDLSWRFLKAFLGGPIMQLDLALCAQSPMFENG